MMSLDSFQGGVDQVCLRPRSTTTMAASTLADSRQDARSHEEYHGTGPHASFGTMFDNVLSVPCLRRLSDANLALNHGLVYTYNNTLPCLSHVN